MTDNELVAKAKEALENSYSPYSHFAVGAALLSTDGQVFIGCNIENSSFGATNCAERTAIFKAVSEGVKDFKAIAIVCSGDQPAYPCGICRQVMSEFFNPDTRIIDYYVLSFPLSRFLLFLAAGVFIYFICRMIVVKKEV